MMSNTAAAAKGTMSDGNVRNMCDRCNEATHRGLLTLQHMCKLCMKLNEKDTSTEEDEEVILVYHSNHSVITCYCGQIIEGRHHCLLANKRVNAIRVVVCDYDGERRKTAECDICSEKEKEKRFIDQWRHDESGYCRCTKCDDKCYGDLPKICACSWYIDREAIPRCKECDEMVEESSDNYSYCANCM